MWILILCLVFINVVMYFSSKRESRYNEGRLFLVTIPDWLMNLLKLKKLRNSLKKNIYGYLLSHLYHLFLYLFFQLNGYYFIL